AAVGTDAQAIPRRAWVFVAVLLGSGFLSLVALTRTGIRAFFAPSGSEGPRIRLAEGVSVVALLAACGALTVAAGPVSRFALEAARALHAPAAYVDAVLGPTAASPGMRRAP
ncbi:MAG TPA: hypothetical protein VFP65_13915, partial [Anaeromyxobacteraceae bacterium]|nr:hypothetical protein [Anaeromyxobacteraceae bacterium]